MENPATIVKNNLTLNRLLGWAFVALVVFAILDVTGLTNWILFPVTTAKLKLAKPAAAA